MDQPTAAMMALDMTCSTGDEMTCFSDDIRRTLSALDERLREVLGRRAIRLVSSEWVLAQPEGFRMLRRQELEEFERNGSGSPLLSDQEAVALLMRGDRSVGALTYGWLTPGDPDPLGARIEILRAALAQLPHIKAFFWDYASLPQWPRSAEEDGLFADALSVMGDMYASAIGTVVLQLKEVPGAPAHLPLGCDLCLYDLCDGVVEQHVLRAFEDVEGCTLSSGRAVVHFSSREAAVTAKQRGAPKSICAALDFLYNARAYDDRGWCCFEDAVSDEMLARLSPKMREALSALPAKKLVLERGQAPICAPDTAEWVDNRFETIQGRITSATFTGKGDKQTVVSMYREYAERIVDALLPVMVLQQEQRVEELAPLPDVDLEPITQQLLYAPGQLVLLADMSLGTVDSTGACVTKALTGDVVELSFDACCQAVLPWRRLKFGWDKALQHDVAELQRLEPLDFNTLQPPCEPGLRALKEAVERIVYNARAAGQKGAKAKETASKSRRACPVGRSLSATASSCTTDSFNIIAAASSPASSGDAARLCSFDAKASAATSGGAAVPFGFGAQVPPPSASSGAASPFGFGAVVSHPPASSGAAGPFSLGAEASHPSASSGAASPFSFDAEAPLPSASSSAVGPFSFSTMASSPSVSSGAAGPLSFSAVASPPSASSGAASPFSFGAEVPPLSMSAGAAGPFSFGAEAPPPAALAGAAGPSNFGAEALPASASSSATGSFSFGAETPPLAASAGAAGPLCFGAEASPPLASAGAAAPSSFGADPPLPAASAGAAAPFSFGAEALHSAASAGAAGSFSFSTMASSPSASAEAAGHLSFSAVARAPSASSGAAGPFTFSTTASSPAASGGATAPFSLNPIGHELPDIEITAKRLSPGTVSAPFNFNALKQGVRLTSPAVVKAVVKAGGLAGTAIESAIQLIMQHKAATKAGEGEVRFADQVQTQLERVQDTCARLQPKAVEGLFIKELQRSGAVGDHRYGASQKLTVQHKGEWHDAEVIDHVADSATLRLGTSGESITFMPHPWNHAPREMPSDAFETVRTWYIASLRRSHSHIRDALTGRSLEALQQCVKIDVESDLSLSSVVDAQSLAMWLCDLHTERCLGVVAELPTVVLLTAGPAAGKTTLLSQLVTLILDRDLIPILVKVQQLQRRLIESRDAFQSAWNWIDAFLRLELGNGAHYRMLRQAMVSRRALLMLDGLDEGGARRVEIEQHVAEVLAPQGHVLLATSRPAGVPEHLFVGFHRLRLSPLTEQQQQQAIEQRLGAEQTAQLLAYVDKRLPRSSDTSNRITSNPLMLSMVTSVFELRRDLGMPSTVTDLYRVASDAMLARGGSAGPRVRRLLQAIFFEAHVAQRRLIEDWQLDEAALALDLPNKLEEIRRGSAVQVSYVADLREVCCQLPEPARKALSEVRERVSHDQLPLLSLLQVDPLQMQSSHLSFQEYFAARAICESGTTLSGPRPWEWPAWWANAVKIGGEMGDAFGKGLMRAAGVEGTSLDLSRKLKGHQPTVLAVLVSAIRSGSLANLTKLDLGFNRIGDEGMQAFSTAITIGSLASLTKLSFYGNQIGDEGMKAFSSALSSGSLASLTDLSLGDNQIGDAGIVAFAGAIGSGSMGSLQKLYLNDNQIGDAGMAAFAEALKPNPSNPMGSLANLTILNLNTNRIGNAGMIAFADAIKPTDEIPMGALANLTNLQLFNNQIGDEGMTAFSSALSSGALRSLQTLWVDNGSMGVDHPALKVVCEARGINYPRWRIFNMDL